MKRVLIIMLMVSFARTASADWMLTLADGTRMVWETCYAKEDRYCTRRDFGEFCVSKDDVLSLKEVPAGTEGSENYGVSALGNSDIQRQNSKTLNTLERQQNERLSRERQERWERQGRQENEGNEEYEEE